MIRRVRVVRRRPDTDGVKAFKGFTLTVFLLCAAMFSLGVSEPAVGPIAFVTILIGLLIGCVSAAISYGKRKG